MVKVLHNNSDFSNAQNTLQCLANFRNSFHCGRIHTINRNKWINGEEPESGKLDRVFNSGGSTIEFKHKVEINYNWKSAFLLIKESVEVLIQVMLSNKNIT